MAASREQILESISQLTLIELTELISEMEKKFGVTAAAPVAIAGMRPCAELKPCAPDRKYVGVFDEQPMPDIFATRCGGRSSS